MLKSFLFTAIALLSTLYVSAQAEERGVTEPYESKYFVSYRGIFLVPSMGIELGYDFHEKFDVRGGITYFKLYFPSSGSINTDFIVDLYLL